MRVTRQEEKVGRGKKMRALRDHRDDQSLPRAADSSISGATASGKALGMAVPSAGITTSVTFALG